MISKKDTYKANLPKQDKSEGWETRPTGILTTKEDGTIEYKCLNEWQLCPKCNGTGNMRGEVKMMRLGPMYGSDVTCDLCNGKKIISKVNGQPPV